MRLFCRSSQRVKATGCFYRGAQSLMFDRFLNATLSEQGVPTTGVSPPCLQILLIHTKHKTKWYLRLTPCLHSFEGTLIHCVGKAKRVTSSWARWCDATPKLWDLSWSNELDLRQTKKQDEISDQPHILIFFIHWVDKTIKPVTNSLPVAHKSCIVRCSPCAPGF